MNSQYIKNKLKMRHPNILGHEKFLRSSVMIPLVKNDNKTNILFEVRSKEMNHQPGEICFPGGKAEEMDINEEYTAKRELCEELGLQIDNIITIAPLDILVTPFKGIIYPFVGEICTPKDIKPNRAEVSETFLVPLEFLLNTEPDKYSMNISLEPHENFPFQIIPNRNQYKLRTYQITEYFYYYEHYVIWGITARILHHFLTLLKSEGIE